MKKNETTIRWYGGLLSKKLLHIMKLAIIFLLISVIQISAVTYSRDARISLVVKNYPLEKIFNEIEKQSGYRFLYNPDIVANEYADITSDNLPVEQILDTLFSERAITYKIMNDELIVISRAGALQEIFINGSITDATTEEPLIGVNIILEGTTVGVTSDINGKFTIKVPSPNATLVFSYIGYISQKVNLQGQSSLSVALVADIKNLEEIVVVGYGSQKKVTASGSIASINNKEIMKAPVANVANALTGIMPGLTVINTSGHVGKDDPVIRLRGIGTMSGQLDPLIMVDGMERPMNDIDPNEIESVSILKDASSTAVFGVRGANGVILVTTKRGKDGPAKVSFSAEYGIARPTRRPEFLSSYEYAVLYNEAQINDGVNPANVKYSAEAIEHYRTGDDPWLYPNTDWQDQMMRDYSPQQRYNLNISGGTKSTRYYVSAGYLAQTGIWKDFKAGYDNTDWSKRYNFRSNLDIDVTKDMTVSVNLGGTIKYVNLPNAQRSSPSDEDWQFFRYMMNAPPMAGAGWVNGKSYIVEGYDTPIKWMTGKGYRNDYNSEVNTLFAINHKLDFVTPGLSAKVKYGYDSNYSINLRRQFTTTVPEYAAQRKPIDTNGDGIMEEVLLFKQLGNPSVLNYSESFGSKRRHVYVEAALDWKRTFGNDHDVSGLLLYNQSKKYYTESAFNEIPLSYLGLVGRFIYSYKSKYNAEFDMGYNGSENFPKDKRFGFFPAYSASWVVSEESFMKSLPFISFLKLKASYGVVGNDKLGGNRFLYIPDSYSISTTSGPVFGVNGTGQAYGNASVTKRGNPDVTWEIDQKQNYAIEMKFFDKLSVNFDYFYNFRSNILQNKQTYTSYVDDRIPPLNFGKMSNKGYELEATWRVSKNKFTYWVKGIYAFARNKVIEMDEPSSVPDWQKQTGRPLGGPVLYLVQGFYETDEQVAAANGITPMDGVAVNTLAGGKVRKGDLWYVDYNDDGKINDLDRVVYGNYTQIPEITGSLAFGGTYKGFDFSVLFQGVTHAVVSYGGESLQPFTSQYLSIMSAQTFVRDRWTEATKETATFPALTLVPGHYNFGGGYGYVNEFFTNDASYIRLKNVEIGYSFSGNLLKKLKCQTIRVYANGSNLITWDKQKLFKFDPEQPGSRGLAYPQQSIYNIGLNLQF